MSDERLYGAPDAEILYDDWADAADAALGWCDPSNGDPVTIEEWTVHPPSYHLPSAARVVEWVDEQVVLDGEISEPVYDDWESASTHPDVIAAFQAALDVMASKVSGRMANEKVATHEVTWDADGNPLLDGEPLHPPAPPNEVRDLMADLEAAIAAAKDARQKREAS